jgi:hypothetical protein
MADPTKDKLTELVDEIDNLRQLMVEATTAAHAGEAHTAEQKITAAASIVKGKVEPQLRDEQAQKKLLRSVPKQVLAEMTSPYVSRPAAAEAVSRPAAVVLKRAADVPTEDIILNYLIRYSAKQVGFENYKNFIDAVMCPDPKKPPTCFTNTCLSKRRFLPFPGVDAYRLLKVATEAFLMCNCCVKLDRTLKQQIISDLTSSDISPSDAENFWQKYFTKINGHDDVTIPYLKLIYDKLKLPLTTSGGDDCENKNVDCYGVMENKLSHPCFLELIWSYWHEEGMLVQTLNAISLRFQNKRGPAEKDPLIRFDIDPLRGLNNLLWGYIEDEQHRLSVVRRAYEYAHHYGLALSGKAVPTLRIADSRSKFLEAFHHLLYLCTVFFKEADDTTVIADGFPVLNALREVNLLLAEGAQNQYGDLPSSARQEMLMQMYLLARPEMQEFLGGKIMVPYPEAWMDRVDTMKTLQRWSDSSIVDFNYLAVAGEQLLLSIRFGKWYDTTATAAQAAAWASFWRELIQRYVHAYRAVTGVDLTNEPVDATLPSLLLQHRLAAQLSAKG